MEKEKIKIYTPHQAKFHLIDNELLFLPAGDEVCSMRVTDKGGKQVIMESKSEPKPYIGSLKQAQSLIDSVFEYYENPDVYILKDTNTDKRKETLIWKVRKFLYLSLFKIKKIIRL